MFGQFLRDRTGARGCSGGGARTGARGCSGVGPAPEHDWRCSGRDLGPCRSANDPTPPGRIGSGARRMVWRISYRWGLLRGTNSVRANPMINKTPFGNCTGARGCSGNPQRPHRSTWMFGRRRRHQSTWMFGPGIGARGCSGHPHWSTHGRCSGGDFGTRARGCSGQAPEHAG